MFISRDAPEQRLIFPDWKTKTFQGVPFMLVDPQEGKVKNAILFYSTHTPLVASMPKTVSLPCNTPAKAIHFLSGVSGWGAQHAQPNGGVCLLVILHYEDGSTEEFPLKNGAHFADYIGPFDVPDSKLAFKLRSQQIRYLAVFPKEAKVIKDIELKKGPDASAPVVMAVTVETRE
jgi:hypothetical protein